MEKPVETPLNVLLISHYFLPRHPAGTEIYTYRLGQALTNRGHCVHVLAGEDDDTAVKPRMWEEDVWRLPVTFMARKRLSKWGHMRQSLRDGQRPELEPLFEEVLNRLKPQIIHIQQLSTLSAGFIHISKRLGIPVVVMLNDYWFLCQRVQLYTYDARRCPGFDAVKCAECLLASYHPLIRIFGKTIARNASERRFRNLTDALQAVDVIISPSRHLKNVYEGHGIGKDRIVHCDYGFPEYTGERNWQPGSPLKVGFLGSLVPHKGLHTLIDAVNMAQSDIRLAVHGSPDANPAYYRELQSRNLNQVQFAGISDPGDPYPTITRYDVMVVPSLWEENSPLVIHEAHAAGRPVIASNVGGIPELIRDGVDGILFPPGDAQALAKALDDLASDVDRLVEMGRQAQPPKLIDDHAREIEDMYIGLLSRKVSA
jgi:glycosyltransferase involved in cell wall biosynthesis